MDWEILYQFILLLAGLGLIIYGIRVINYGSQGFLGKNFQYKLGKKAKNNFKNVLIGTGTTTVLQSSTITNVMTTGLLSVGTIGLQQAMACVIGTGIGSALAMLLLMLESISLLKIFSIFVVIGAIMLLFSKSKKLESISFFVLGFGMLCLGITLISSTVSWLIATIDMSGFFHAISNPFVLIVIGILLCTITQTAYPVIAILIPFVNGGLMSFDMACFCILGVNIGASLAVPLLMHLCGDDTNNKRFVLFNFFVKIFVCVVFGFLMLIPNWTSFFYNTISGGEASIAVVLIHLIYNLFPLILLPLLNPLSKMMQKLVKQKPLKNSELSFFQIDEMSVTSSSVAHEIIKNNILKILKMESRIYDKISSNIFSKDQYELSLNSKLFERIIRLTTNSAIRFGGMYEDSELENMRAFVDILANETQILQANQKLLKIQERADKNQIRLTKTQSEKLKVLASDIKDMAVLACDICKNPKEKKNKSKLNLIFSMHDQNENNMAQAKKDCIKSNRNQSKDSILFFAIIDQLDKIENEIVDIIIKMSLMEE